jgi:hypothetical protein
LLAIKAIPTVADAIYGAIRFIAFSSFGFRFLPAKRFHFNAGAQFPGKPTTYQNRSIPSAKIRLARVGTADRNLK